MGQIKNIKLHIVTDIKKLEMNFVVIVTLLLTLCSSGHGAPTSSIVSNDNNVGADCREMKKDMSLMQRTISSLQDELKMVKAEIKRGNDEREKMKNQLDTSFDDKSSNKDIQAVIQVMKKDIKT